MFNQINKVMYATDLVVILKEYIDNLDSYYSNYDNRYKDPVAFDYYSDLKQQCLNKAKDRGVISES